MAAGVMLVGASAVIQPNGQEDRPERDGQLITAINRATSSPVENAPFLVIDRLQHNTANQEHRRESKDDQKDCFRATKKADDYRGKQQRGVDPEKAVIPVGAGHHDQNAAIRSPSTRE